MKLFGEDGKPRNYDISLVARCSYSDELRLQLLGWLVVGGQLKIKILPGEYRQLFCSIFKHQKKKERLLMIPNESCITAPKNLETQSPRFSFDVSGAGTPLPLCQLVNSKRSLSLRFC
ncbi:MAG: hypothetical protein ABI999_00355 [Acidobacteriota bacterium]